MAQHHATSGEVVDLRPLGPRLKETKSSAVIKADHFEAIRLIVLAGSEIPAHEVSGYITLHCLEGRVEIGLDDSTIELKANDWVYLNGGEAHSVKGIKDSSLLLTILLE